MITKAIIESILDDGKYAKVRVPVFNKASTAIGATQTNHLNLAPIVTLPGISPRYQVGDTVYVAFEDDDISQPVILGSLMSVPTNSTSNINVQSVVVTSDATMPDKIKIGNIECSGTSLEILISQLRDSSHKTKQLQETVQNVFEADNTSNMKPDNNESINDIEIVNKVNTLIAQLNEAIQRINQIEETN